MGGFLDKPETSKVTEVGQGKVGEGVVRYAASSMQGWRLEMEDAHVAQVGIEGKQIAIFSVFDGHAGKLAAIHAAGNVQRILAMQPDFAKCEDDAEALGDALKETYSDLDEDLMELPKVQEGKDNSGCTAITVCVTKTHYVVANAGDSRMILCSGSQVTFASRDHKPDDAVETARILRAGGMVFAKRVNGDLAVSRALGDFMYKRVPGVPAGEQPVTAVPDVTIIPRDAQLDQFLLVACDGVWDVMTNEACAEFMLDKMTTGYGLGRCCELLLDHCLQAGSRDNMTVVVVALPGAPKQIGTFREPVPPTPPRPNGQPPGSGSPRRTASGKTADADGSGSASGSASSSTTGTDNPASHRDDEDDEE